MPQKTYKINASYEVAGFMLVTASSKKEAEDKAQELLEDQGGEVITDVYIREIFARIEE